MADRPVMVITGTRKGIGRHLAEYYSAGGYLVVGCSRQATDFSLPHYEHHVLDVSDEEAVSALFNHIRTKHERVDALVNNAGIASMNHVLTTPLRSVEAIFRTNVLGTFVFCREAAKLMTKRGGGRIVNFATVATPLKLEGEAAYAASKAAVESLTEILARELGEFHITVNAVGPTPIQTDLIRSVPKSKIDDLLRRQAIRRLGEFRDVTNVIDFFLQPSTDFVTGQTIYLGGV
jgi:3-oxoacyl-[acyl-carrier protein] reductase